MIAASALPMPRRYVLSVHILASASLTILEIGIRYKPHTMSGKDLLGKALYQGVVNARKLVFLLAIAGLSALLALPMTSKKTFFDENALLVGSAETKIECGPHFTTD